MRRIQPLAFIAASSLFAILAGPVAAAPVAAGAAPGEQGALPEVPEAEHWRAQRPETGEPPAPVLPAFQKTTLDNGLTLLVADVGQFPLVSFQLVTRGGAALDPSGKAGLTALTYGMLNEGSAGLDALAFSDRLADLGANFSSASDRDRGVVAISGLERNADAMMALLAGAVLQPSLEQDDFGRLQQQTLAALERNRGSPQGLAFERLPALLYGAGHPYGHPPTGVPETVQAVTLEDVRAQHGRVFSPASSALVVAGKLNLEQAKALAERHLGGWPKGAAAPLEIGAVEAQPRKQVNIVHKPASPQTMTVIGRPLFGRGHPDEAALNVANQVFGGAFAARLNMNLREDKGYTYGAHSQTAYRIGSGAFTASSALRQDVTAAGLREFFLELEGMKSNPPSEEEVEDAKAGIIRSLTGSFETVSSVAGAAGSIFVYDLPLDYYARLGAKYEAVDVAAVRAAAEKYLVPERMQVLLVGDAPAISAEVEKLNLGPVVVEQ